MNGSYHFREPKRVTLGSVGPPGQRVFYLQARQGEQLVSLKLEKQQVAYLTAGLREVLADLASARPRAGQASEDLEEPVEEHWVVGTMELAYDPAGDRIVLVASEVVPASEGDVDDEGQGDEGQGDEGQGDEGQGDEDNQEDQGPPDVRALTPGLLASDDQGPVTGGVARFEITREQAATMIEEGRRLLRGGRPPCPLCGFPLTEDHSCPKANGHRAPSL